MPLLEEEQLKKQLQAGKFEKVYLLIGEDGYLKQHYAQTICQKAVGGVLEELNAVRLEGKRLSAQALYDNVTQLPVMAAHRCVVVVDYDLPSKGEQEQKAVLQLLSDLPETTVLVFWQDTIPINYKKPEKWRKLITAVNQAGATLDLGHKTDAALCAWMKSYAARRKVRLDTSVAKYMLSVCSNDLNLLRGELEKLCAYKGPDSWVTGEDIDQICIKTVDASVFALARQVLAGEAGQALRTLDGLLYLKVHAVQILSILAGNYIDLYRAKAAMEAGLRPSQIAEDFGYAKNVRFKLDHAARVAEKLPKTALRDSLDLLYDTDLAIKSTSADTRTLLETAILKLVDLIKGAQY